MTTYYLENILSLLKSMINLYINAEVESTNPEVKKLMHTHLNDCLDQQYNFYKQMEKDGIYNVKNLTKEDINKTYKNLKQK